MGVKGPRAGELELLRAVERAARALVAGDDSADDHLGPGRKALLDALGVALGNVDRFREGQPRPADNPSEND